MAPDLLYKGHEFGSTSGVPMNFSTQADRPGRFRLIRRNKGAHVIVVGNEKGGAGKSTVAMHLSIALMRMGKSVGVIDLDLRQRSFGRYLQNRRAWMDTYGVELPIPTEIRLEASPLRHLDEAEAEEDARFQAAFSELKAAHDFIVIDAPGSDTYYSRLAHAVADTIITPVNDSFVDFDLLAEIDAQTFEVGRPSVYAEMVWECRKKRAGRDRTSIDWVVMRNRMSQLDARNKRRVGEGLKKLSERIGFRMAPGFAERVIYRELFPLGLTLLDLTEDGSAVTFSMSHVAARQELRELLTVLKLPELADTKIPF
jgi:chromosome partitioning protein